VAQPEKKGPQDGTKLALKDCGSTARPTPRAFVTAVHRLPARLSLSVSAARETRHPDRRLAVREEFVHIHRRSRGTLIK